LRYDILVIKQKATMSKNLAFDFKVDKENKTITVKREFAADTSLVWDAHTQSEILDKWWAPKPWKARTKTMDFRDGGYWLYAMVGPGGEEHWSRSDYSGIKAQKGFTWHDAFTDENGNIDKNMPRSKWEISFTNNGTVTAVEYRISYNDIAQLEKTIEMGFKEGFTMGLENLDELLNKIGYA